MDPRFRGDDIADDTSSRHVVASCCLHKMELAPICAFTTFVDAIFTTLLDAAFTNTCDVIARFQAYACVWRACRAD
jgi:hypothetical protein